VWHLPNALLLCCLVVTSLLQLKAAILRNRDGTKVKRRRAAELINGTIVIKLLRLYDGKKVRL
jgi:hypothetical protein